MAHKGLVASSGQLVQSQFQIQHSQRVVLQHSPLTRHAAQDEPAESKSSWDNTELLSFPSPSSITSSALLGDVVTLIRSLQQNAERASSRAEEALWQTLLRQIDESVDLYRTGKLDTAQLSSGVVCTVTDAMQVLLSEKWRRMFQKLSLSDPLMEHVDQSNSGTSAGTLHYWLQPFGSTSPWRLTSCDISDNRLTSWLHYDYDWASLHDMYHGQNDPGMATLARWRFHKKPRHPAPSPKQAALLLSEALAAGPLALPYPPSTPLTASAPLPLADERKFNEISRILFLAQQCVHHGQKSMTLLSTTDYVDMLFLLHNIVNADSSRSPSRFLRSLGAQLLPLWTRALPDNGKTVGLLSNL